MLTFSCKEEEEEEETAIYQEELFTDKSWKASSQQIINKVTYYHTSLTFLTLPYTSFISGGNTIYIMKDYYTANITFDDSDCANDYVMKFSSDNSSLLQITGSSYCDSYVPASSVENFALWYIINGKIVINYDEEYYESIHGITYDEIQNKYYELLSLNDTSMTLQRTISGDDLGVYLNTTTQVKGSIVFTLKYINDNANSFDNLKRSDDLPSTNVQTSNNDMLKNNITSPF